MKRMYVPVLLLFLILGSLNGCLEANIDNTSIELRFDDEGNYSGFFNLPSDYKIEEAEKEGHYVTQDSKTIANGQLWENFVQTASEKNNIGIRMVRFYSEPERGPYFIDLFYEDGVYYLFDSSADKQEKLPFTYLLTLKGRFGNPVRDSGVVVLSNDISLTFDQVMKALLSSGSIDIKRISPFKIVMFL